MTSVATRLGPSSPPSSPAVIAVHLLYQGRTLCPVMALQPTGEWPAGHRWVRPADKDRVTCPDCKKALASPPTEAQQRALYLRLAADRAQVKAEKLLADAAEAKAIARELEAGVLPVGELHERGKNLFQGVDL